LRGKEKPEEYTRFLADKRESTFYEAIERIYKLGIIDKTARRTLHNYRRERNEIVHDLFRFKTINLTNKVAFKDFHIERHKRIYLCAGLKL